MSYVYLPFTSVSGYATVGHFSPGGKWIAENDHRTDQEAAERVHWLNGANDYALDARIEGLKSQLIALLDAVDYTAGNCHDHETIDQARKAIAKLGGAK